MPHVLLNSSVLRWLQKQDGDEDKTWRAAGRVASCRTTDSRAGLYTKKSMRLSPKVPNSPKNVSNWFQTAD